MTLIIDMRERSRSPRAPRRRSRRVGLVTIVLLIVGGWFVLLSILGRRLQRGRLQRLGADGWGDAIPDELLAKTDEYRVAAELAEAVRAWTAVRRRRLGSEAVEPPPPASFLSS